MFGDEKTPTAFPSRPPTRDSPSSRRRGGLIASVVGALAAALTLSAPAAAQPSAGTCAAEIRGGVWLSGEEVPVVTGAPVEDTESSGMSLGLGGGCGLSRLVALGLAAEVDYGGELTRYRTLLVGSLRIAGSGSAPEVGTSLSLRGGAGWAFTGEGTEGSVLLTPIDTVALDPGTSGPALAAGLRGRAALSSSVAAFLDAGWRAAFLELSRFDGSGEEEEGVVDETLHAFPLTAGLELQF